VAELNFSDPEAPFELAKRRGESPLLVLLDGITDPRNYGAIIRSALALGAHGVVSEERRSAPLSALVLKASAGTALKLPLVQVKNLARYLEELKGRGVWVYGATGEAAKDLEALDYRRPLAIAIGSEGEGLRRLVAERCDELLRIPMHPEAESLNASVALGIVLYRVRLGRA
jgi:23S rRNA (guanosine2251-2'-O)-methyltransferase